MQRAISSPLLEDASIHGALGVLINVTGGEDMSLHEVSEAADIIQEAADPDANIIFGTVIDRQMQGKVKITVIATGFLRDDDARGEARRAEWQRQPAGAVTAGPGHEQQPQAGAHGGRQFLRPGQADLLDLDATDDGFTPNFGKMKDDLDVPAFLRKQMD